MAPEIDANGHRSKHPEPSGVSQRFTIDIDTGGTFTDCYVEGGGQVVLSKSDTTPHDLSQGVLDCIDRAAAALGMERSALLWQSAAIRLSTTIATNTFINKSGAKVGLLLGESLADRLGEMGRDVPLDMDRVAAIPETAGERETKAVRMATRTLLERGARVLVIALGGGGDLREREKRVREIIAADYPRHYLGAVPTLPSHQVTPIADGLVRIQTAILDAYIHPVISRFLYRVEDQLRRDGFLRPLQVANANGGTSRVAKTTAIRTWGSGPAGGVAGAAEMARQLRLDHVAAVDVGGTSSDISLIVKGDFGYQVDPEIEGARASLPAVRLHSAALGCGSIARAADGEISVGPESAGAQPGPACFGLGGQQATVTDAACCLGYFDPANFLGGRRILDIDAARRVIETAIAAPLSLSIEEAARRVIEKAAALVAAGIAGQLLQKNLNVGDCALFATGGGGGILGHEIARQLQVPVLYAFPVNPVFSAFGLSRLDVLHTYEAFPEAGGVEDEIAGMCRAATLDIRSEGFDPEAVDWRFEAEFDDGGRVAVVDFGDHPEAVAKAVRSPERAFRLIRLLVVAPGRRSELQKIGAGADASVANASRQIYWSRAVTDTRLLDWTKLAEGTAIDGPAVLETSETTLVIPPGVQGRIGPMGEVKIDVSLGSRSGEAGNTEKEAV